MIFVAYELNLPLNMEKPHYRSQRTGEWGLIWARDSRLIYRALTYIAVPLLGPHQPRYIGLTLYIEMSPWDFKDRIFTLKQFLSIDCFDIKMLSYHYTEHHNKDKDSRQCNIYNVNIYIWKDSLCIGTDHQRLQSNMLLTDCITSLLTHLPLDKMAAISQTIFSDAFSWMKSFVFWLKFHWSVFLRVQLTITKHWFR